MKMFLSLGTMVRALSAGSLSRAELDDPRALFLLLGPRRRIEVSEGVEHTLLELYLEQYTAVTRAIHAAEKDGRVVWVESSFENAHVRETVESLQTLLRRNGLRNQFTKVEGLTGNDNFFEVVQSAIEEIRPESVEVFELNFMTN